MHSDTIERRPTNRRANPALLEDLGTKQVETVVSRSLLGLDLKPSLPTRVCGPFTRETLRLMALQESLV